ncbi:hypothetical protein SAMN04487934_10592 [Eubacterium ruminantium]|nr:hypothetical protein SAMN04487934_10592 [Eubacterium ruminantium]
MKRHISVLGKTAFVTSLAGGVFLAMGWPFFSFITYYGKKKNGKVKENSKKWFRLKHTEINHPRHLFADEYEESKKWCEEQSMQDWYISSCDGLKLHASYFPAEDPKRIILMSHGYKGNKFGSMGHMARFLHKSGCSLLFIDQRCCGESEGKYITFGAKEHLDVLRWLKTLDKMNKDKLPIYLYGQSMGAATVLLAAEKKLPEEVRGIIADCGFHSMKDQLRDIASGWFHLHWVELLLLRVDLFCRIFAKFSMKETDVTNALKKNKVPVLFFHGEDDTYVTPDNTVRNYEICKASKEMVLIPGARHLSSSFAAPDLYKEKLLKMFSERDGK